MFFFEIVMGGNQLLFVFYFYLTINFNNFRFAYNMKLFNIQVVIWWMYEYMWAFVNKTIL